MYIAPKTIKAPQPQPLRYWPENAVSLNGGLNLVDKEWMLKENQTSKVSNMWFKDGELSKRYGQEYMSVGVGISIFNAYKYRFYNKIIFHAGTNLYAWETYDSILIYEGLPEEKGSFFKFNGKLYYVCGNKFIQYDGTTVSEIVPYVPTVIINRLPSGGGDLNEDYNRIGDWFKDSFNGDGTSTVYTLTDNQLNAGTVNATVNGTLLVETVDFSVSRINGTVTFVTPPASGQNNVVIEANKVDSIAKASILNCKYAIPFGGQNDNRLFLGGNGTGYFYWTGITLAGIDATYFPYNNYNIIGDAGEDITGFGKQYDILCIFKAREMYGESYTFNGTKGIFNTYPINSQIGCDCPDTIQTIENNLTWCNTFGGVYTLVGTAVQSEKNIRQISRNVNPRLLNELNLQSASSVDFEGRYWLCVNDKVYLWDYFTSPYVETGNPEGSARALSWWYFTNVNAKVFIIDNQDLFYMPKEGSQLVKFHKAYDSLQFYDFGQSIPAVYRYPVREMGNGIYEFSVLKGFLGVRGDSKTYFTVTYFTSDDWQGDPSIETVEVGSYAWESFTWDTFIWDVMGLKFEAILVPGAKNIRYFGAEFNNNEAGKDMNISSLNWQYKITKQVK